MKDDNSAAHPRLSETSKAIESGLQSSTKNGESVIVVCKSVTE